MSTSGQVYWVVGAVGVISCWTKMNQSKYPIGLGFSELLVGNAGNVHWPVKRRFGDGEESCRCGIVFIGSTGLTATVLTLRRVDDGVLSCLGGWEWC